MSKLKLKGAYVHGDELELHKSHSQQVVALAAIDVLTNGVSVAEAVRKCTDPFYFLISVKLPKSNTLLWGEESIQNVSRFMVTKNGKPLVKKMPPNGVIGEYKKKPNFPKEQYLLSDNTRWNPDKHSGKALVHNTRSGGIRGEYVKRVDATQEEYDDWDNTVFNYDLHQITATTHQERFASIAGGNKVTICNDMNGVTLDDVDYEYYEKEVDKITQPLLNSPKL